ncbi:MAG: GAF domain-containing protein [Nitrospiraceae bacterium]
MRRTDASKRTSKAPPKRRSGRGIKGKPAGGSATTTLDHRLQQRLLDTISNCEEKRRSPEGVADIFAREFCDLPRVGGIAVYLRDEQTKDMRCLAEASHADGPIAGEWKVAREMIELGARVEAKAPLLVFPLKQIGQLDGLLLVQNAGARQDQDVIKLLEGGVPWLSVALDHARLAQKYAKKIIRIQCLEEVSDVLNSSLTDDDKLRHALEASIRLVEARAGALFLLSEAKGTLSTKVVAGETAPSFKDAGMGAAETVVRTGKPMLIKDTLRDQEFRQRNGWRLPFVVHTLVSVPIRSSGKLLGVMEAVNTNTGRPFSNWDVLELGSLCNQLGLVLTQAAANRSAN